MQIKKRSWFQKGWRREIRARVAIAKELLLHGEIEYRVSCHRCQEEFDYPIEAKYWK